MANAKRDENYVPVVMAVTDDSNLTPTMLVVDSVTDRLLIEIVDLSSGSPSASTTAKRDGNYKTTAMGTTDDANLTSENFITHSGYLGVDVLAE
jgi:hypothetical protein